MKKPKAVIKDLKVRNDEAVKGGNFLSKISGAYKKVTPLGTVTPETV